MFLNEDALKYVCRLSEEKGRAITEKYPEHIVISSDTIVIHNDKILGKPIDKEDAFQMLRALSGDSHEVITAFSIQSNKMNIDLTEYEVTEVHFRKLSDDDIIDYIAGGSPMDKAGAYGIQDVEAYLVDSINGSYHNVIGFPVSHFALKWNTIFNRLL
ncbi:MAG: septum formation protein Maf, partial [Candidatus Marinimicrobia bacterium]|nr:septum formation protein Maf [Candidatus Neomarinimicrobiota bacterium]